MWRPNSRTLKKVKVLAPIIEEAVSSQEIVPESIIPRTLSDFTMRTGQAEAQSLTRFRAQKPLSTTRVSPVSTSLIRDFTRQRPLLEDPYAVPADLEAQVELHTVGRAMAMSRSLVQTAMTIKYLQPLLVDRSIVIDIGKTRYHWASGQGQYTNMAHAVPCQIIINGQTPDSHWPPNSFQAETIRFTYGHGLILPRVVNSVDSLIERDSKGVSGLRDAFTKSHRQIGTYLMSNEEFMIHLPLVTEELQHNYLRIQKAREEWLKEQIIYHKHNPEKRAEYERQLQVCEVGKSVIQDIEMTLPKRELDVLIASLEGEPDLSDPLPINPATGSPITLEEYLETSQTSSGQATPDSGGTLE